MARKRKASDTVDIEVVGNDDVLNSPPPLPSTDACAWASVAAAAQQQQRGRKRFVGVRQRPSGRWVAEIKDTIQKIRVWEACRKKQRDEAQQQHQEQAPSPEPEAAEDGNGKAAQDECSAGSGAPEATSSSSEASDGDGDSDVLLWSSLDLAPIC